MVGIGKVQYRVANYHCGLFMGAHKASGERVVVQLDYCSLPHPLPELRLRGPELLPVEAEHQGSSLIFLFTGFLR